MGKENKNNVTKSDIQEESINNFQLSKEICGFFLIPHT